MSELTLVTGGGGKTGRRIVEGLKAQGRQVRVGGRSAAPRFDWEDRSTWGAALEGVSAVYVCFQPDLAVPQALEIVTAFYAQAMAAGATKLVLLSGRGEPEAQEAETALMALDVDWTVLRASWFSQNFSEAFFLEPLQAGALPLPVGAVAEPFLDVDDVAEIAIQALTGPRHSRRLYDLTGPRALSFQQAVEEIAAAAGRDIRFVSVPAPDYRAAMAEVGTPDEVIDLTLYLFTTVLDGRNTQVADGVMQALGRPPRDFADYATRTAATGVWGGEHV